MKTVLLAGVAAALLLLGSLAYWNTRPARSSAPEIRAQKDPPVLESSPTDLEAAEALPELEPATSARSKVELPPAPEPGLETDMADRISFAKKYAGVDASGRAAAMDAIRLRVAGNLLTAEELVAAGRELDWLAAHENP